jgi:clan AA aspartic protease
MGAFKVAAQVGDAAGIRFEPVELLVDTGASYLALPASLLRRLNVTEYETRTFSLADGRIIERGVGIASLRIDGRTLPVLCVFNDDGTEPVLGAVALETFGLGVDPVAHKLVPVRGYLL